MTEEFLHYLWKFRLFDMSQLKTADGESLKIIHPGTHNLNAGPDFFNARIKIGTTEWAGNVEIHINASDWKKHAHQKDKAYNNVILHVVYHNDTIIYRSDREVLPTLLLRNRIDQSLYKKHQGFQSAKSWIPCEKQWASMGSFPVNTWFNRLLVERLERKSAVILELLGYNKQNWEETFYQHLARSFGFKTNALPFELLAKSLPNAFLAKHKNSYLQIEAMLFGQAGFLERHFTDEYPRQLQNEYHFLKQKFKLTPIDGHLWKLARMRPVNFPAIRIAQFAALIFKSVHLFSKVIEVENYKKLKSLLDVEPSSYWKTHYTFDKASPEKSKRLGDEAINNIIINTIVPFIFLYGKQKAEEHYCSFALDLLERAPGEQNSIITKWSTMNVSVKTAFSTQALLQLKNEYCDKKRCLQCTIGHKLLTA